MSVVQRIQPGLYRTPDARFEIQYEEWWLDGECGCAVCEGYIYADCPNDGFGKRSGWTVWDVAESDHLTGEPFSFDTYREARDYLALHLARTATQREP